MDQVRLHRLPITYYVLRMASYQFLLTLGLQLPGVLQYLSRVFERCLRNGHAAYHGGYFLLLGGGVQFLHVRAGAVACHLFSDLEMVVRKGGYLWQVGYAQHLVAAGEAPQLLANHAPTAPAHAHVHLVEYQRWGEVG